MMKGVSVFMGSAVFILLLSTALSSACDESPIDRGAAGSTSPVEASNQSELQIKVEERSGPAAVILDSAQVIGGTSELNTPTLFVHNVLIDRRGRVVLGDNYSGVPSVFIGDSAIPISRHGGGPGEIANVLGVASDDQGFIYVLDTRGIINVFNDSLKFVSEMKFPNIMQAPVISGNHMYLAKGPTRTPRANFMVTDLHGNLVREFGRVAAIPEGRSFVLTPHPDGGVITGDRFSYRFTRFSESGDSLYTIVRPDAGEWFQPGSTKCDGKVQPVTFPTTVTDIRIDKKRNTLLMFRHRRLDKCAPQRNDGRPMDPRTRDDVMDTRLVVYDKVGKMSADVVVNQALDGFLDDSHVWRLVELESSTLAIQIIKFRIIAK